MTHLTDLLRDVPRMASDDKGDYLVRLSDVLAALSAAPCTESAVTVGVRVKPLEFRDEMGVGVLTSRETGELFRIFPQADGTFFAPKLPEDECSAPDAQTLIDRINARWSARIMAALTPAPAKPEGRRDDEVRRKALMEAADVVAAILTQDAKAAEPHDTACASDRWEYAEQLPKAILALIEKDTK